MQFRISFASLVTGFIIVCMTFGVITTMILDLNTAADDDQMHSENLRIRVNLTPMQVETRELQRLDRITAGLLFAYRYIH